MFKWISRFLALIGIVTALTFTGAQMGFLTGSRPSKLGLTNGQLHPVKAHLQNSVSSFADTDEHKIAAFVAAPNPRQTFTRLADAVKATSGATVVTQDGNYIYAEFQTPLMKFTDDVEFLLDEGNAVIHVRSASRLGRKDFGANRKRIELLREAIKTKLG